MVGRSIERLLYAVAPLSVRRQIGRATVVRLHQDRNSQSLKRATFWSDGLGTENAEHAALALWMTDRVKCTR